MTSAVRILQLTDLHILSKPEQTMADVDTLKSFKKVIKLAHQQHAPFDLILLTGDLAQDPCLSAYQKIHDVILQYSTQTICLPGNHDDFEVMQQVFNNSLINCSKHLLYKNWQIISLNSKKMGSPAGYLSTIELDYLLDKLKQSSELNTLLAVHHHPVKIHSPWMDGMMIENYQKLLSIISNNQQIRATLCGHIHQEFAYKINNNIIYGTPSTCFQFKPNCTEYTLDNKQAGYRTLCLHPNGSVDSQVYRLPT